MRAEQQGLLGSWALDVTLQSDCLVGLVPSGTSCANNSRKQGAF